jgi:glycerol-3-phosphate dehydrogenase
MNRNQQINRLKEESFDLCIIGGGASGAGCALDAALRGLRVALIDRHDFAAETSSKSTKLVHGGVRYLEQAFKNLDLAQLRQERHIVLENAPHLAQPLGLITPVFSWWESLYFSIGLKMYGWFASGKDQLPKSRRLSKKEALARMPGLSPHIHSAVLYYDGQLDDARYCLALVQTACEAGATVANYVKVIDFQKDSTHKLEAARVLDERSGAIFQIRASVFLNCTGAGADAIRLLANPFLPPRLQPSKGVHAVLPLPVLGGTDALLIPQTRDGRVVFAVPFEGYLLLGTTDDPVKNVEKEPVLEAVEIDYLLETLQRFLEKKIDKKMVSAGFGGLRPLLSAQNNALNNIKTKTLLRDHEVESDPVSGLFSLLGGKWTTYRLMASDAVDAVCNTLQVSALCNTQTHLLVGAQGWTTDLAANLESEYGLDADVCVHLSRKYGARAREVAHLAQKEAPLAKRIIPEYAAICAEIVYAVRMEMACKVRDFLARRIRLEMTDWALARKATPAVAHLMGAELGWSEQETRQQATEYLALLESFENRSKGRM